MLEGHLCIRFKETTQLTHNGYRVLTVKKLREHAKSVEKKLQRQHDKGLITLTSIVYTESEVTFKWQKHN